MSKTKNKAEREFDILNKTVKDAIIIPFRKEILALVDKFGNSGQSGGSAPYTAGAISQAVKALCLQQPICDITGIEEEWRKLDYDDKLKYQNNRCSAVFKDGDDRSYYIDAIVFKGDIGGCFTGNSVRLKDGSLLDSSQFIKGFPFKPKTFYVDVIDYRFDKNKETGELTPNIDGDWWEHEIKNESQLKEIFEYYEIKNNINN